MSELHVVVGHPYSDIGKGWVASSIGAQLGPETPVIKIDPMLSPGFPAELGIPMGGTVVTDDAKTYARRGLGFHPNRNIVLGGWMREALERQALGAGILGDEAPKVTYADLSYRLADTLRAALGDRSGVIEIGGCPDDPEAALPASAIRALSHESDVTLHLLTAYDYTTRAERQYDVKTRMPVRAITETMRSYWGISLDSLSVYIRRANVPDDVSDELLRAATEKVAFKTNLRPEQVRYIPNLQEPEQLDAYVSPRLDDTTTLKLA